MRSTLDLELHLIAPDSAVGCQSHCLSLLFAFNERPTSGTVSRNSVDLKACVTTKAESKPLACDGLDTKFISDEACCLQSLELHTVFVRKHYGDLR
ncbi:hypothetical protein FFI97_019460 [Variovorax sp. KBS0712]|uniref:hypothetical protein n=1 Tax=Variovorax sp. KBS0712 TaxID=2578111 RepID=UPI00111AD10E|nr:hypothetical protein [Variovorax sp. KBS0712]TSD56412.1 hypothetical protein FFI97_019460 [Variovorax sp. KBS0712]